jgi:hypothetical protein
MSKKKFGYIDKKKISIPCPARKIDISIPVMPCILSDIFTPFGNG